MGAASYALKPPQPDAQLQRSERNNVLVGVGVTPAIHTSERCRRGSLLTTEDAAQSRFFVNCEGISAALIETKKGVLRPLRGIF